MDNSGTNTEITPVQTTIIDVVQQPPNPFSQVLFGDETFSTLYNTIMQKLAVVEGVNMDVFSAIQTKILSGEAVSLETLLILGPIAREYIQEARMLVEAYIKLMQTMGTISKSVNIGIMTPTVNLNTTGANQQLAHVADVDPLAPSFLKQLDKSKEIVVADDDEFSGNASQDDSTKEYSVPVKIIHSPAFANKAAELEEGKDNNNNRRLSIVDNTAEDMF